MFDTWTAHMALWQVGAALLVMMALAALVGMWLRSLKDRSKTKDGHSDSQEAYIVSGVLGLLALLLSFTFGLAVDRFDARRIFVLESANAIGTTYLRAQLLDEPHRTRISNILTAYTDNVIVLAQLKPNDSQGPKLLARDDALLNELWAATAAAFDSVRNVGFSISLLETTNQMIDMDASRRAARQARVPGQVFNVLFTYMITTAGVLAYALTGFRGRVSASLLLALMTLSLLLILDIDRPTLGGIRESQKPMTDLRASMSQQPPGTFDRWRTPAVARP
jgi:hypothetical protein